MTAFRFLAIAILATAYAIAGNHLPHANCSEAETYSSQEVEELLQQLDASRFASREAATNELIEMGVETLKPLALHFIGSSPEAAWRIKRILERISVQSEAEVASLKAIGLLILLDHKVDAELAGLIQKWRQNRSQRAIEYFVSKGASTAPTGINRRLVQAPFRRGIINRGFEIHRGSSIPQNPLRRPIPSKLAPEELRSEIAKVINGNFDEVQKFVFDRLPDGLNPDEQLLDDPFIVDALMGGIGTGNQQQSFLEFGDNWRGSPADFARLSEIHSLAGIRFKNLKIESDDLQSVASLNNLRHIGISNSKFVSGELADLQLPIRISSIELENYSLDSATVQWLSKKPIQTLTINRCKISDEAASSFDEFQYLQALSVGRTQLKPDVFKTWLGMTELKRISLAVCKFPPDAYRQFNRIRPRVIFFNPVSFLGVQGLQDGRGTISCEIEQVVAGSGAEKAGIQPGDVITKVNDDPIESFNELRMFISQFDIGEDMKLTVQRDGNEIDLTAQLGTNTTVPIR